MLTENSEKTQPNYSTILSVTMDLIKLLQKTDQPQLAVDVVLQILKYFPDASSYHRQIKLVKLGARLLPHHAAQMFNMSANFVCNAVKIMTVKMLAQLLADATLIDISTRPGVLQNIFDSNHHIDERSEVVMAVLRLFSRASTFTSVSAAMASMANAASGPSEREPISEADWLAAEKGETPLPEVAPVSDRPLFRCFLETAFDYLPEQHRREYLQKVLLPLLEESARQHTRWIRCLLSQVHLTPDEDSAITSLGKGWTFDPCALHSLFNKWRWCLPKSYLHQHRCWALAYLHYPHVEAINQKLSAKNKRWRGSTEGKHWLTLQSHLRSWRPFAAIGGSIATGVQLQAEDDITVPDLVEEYVCRAGIVSRHPLSFEKDVNQFVVSIEASLEVVGDLEGRNEV